MVITGTSAFGFQRQCWIACFFFKQACSEYTSRTGRKTHKYWSKQGHLFPLWGCFVRFKLILVYHDCYIIFVILILFFKHQCHCNYHFIIIFIVIFWTIRILLDILILVITIVTLPFCINPSVCIFSIQLFPHFLKCWQGEFVF